MTRPATLPEHLLQGDPQPRKKAGPQVVPLLEQPLEYQSPLLPDQNLHCPGVVVDPPIPVRAVFLRNPHIVPDGLPGLGRKHEAILIGPGAPLQSEIAAS